MALIDLSPIRELGEAILKELREIKERLPEKKPYDPPNMTITARPAKK